MCLPGPSLCSSVVFFELQRAHLITIEECRWLSDINGLARVQSKKTLGIMNKSAEIMRKHGFKKEARFLSGNFDIDPDC